MSRTIPLLALLTVLWGCDTTGVATESAVDDQPSLGFELARSMNSTLPQSVDRVRLRVWNDATDRTVDVVLPAEGSTRSVGVNVPAGSYDVGLVVYSDAWNEAYAFAEQGGIDVVPNTFTEVALDLENMQIGPDYLLDQEIQITPEIGALTLDAFFTVPDLHPSLPHANIHYDTETFASPDSARYETVMTPELDAYYTARLSELDDDLASVDSVYFRVATPLSNAWGDSLRAIAPSVAGGEDAYSASLGGGIVVMFLEQNLPLVGRPDGRMGEKRFDARMTSEDVACTGGRAEAPKLVQTDKATKQHHAKQEDRASCAMHG